MRLLLLTGFVAIASLASVRPTAGIEFQALTPDSASRVDNRPGRNGAALQEMLGNVATPQRWRQAPKLTVVVSVMSYQPGDDVQYTATGERLSEADADNLVSDLTNGLSVLTAGTFAQFSSVTREVAGAGALVSVSRPDHIVIARIMGLRGSVGKLGYGGRRARKDGTITAGAILLDDDFDRTSAKRRLVRTHELGHALGYNHVRSRTSIMNPQVGAELTDFDREAAMIAFREPAFAALRRER